jgi:hypothetical protein
MIVITVGRIAAVPTPCTTRKVISTGSVGALIAPTPPSATVPTAQQNRRRRPTQSPSQPVSGISTANVRLNAITTKAPWDSGALK